MSTPSKTSAAPPSPEPVFLDPCFGRTVATRLRAHGWIVHQIGEHFPDDAQHVSDPDWIRFGAQRGWTLITQDKRIRYREDELAAVQQTAGVMLQLADGNLTIADKVERLTAHRDAIFAAARREGPALYRAYADPGQRFTVSASIEWRATWTGGGQSGTLPDLATTTSQRRPLEQIQSVIAG